MSPQGRVILFCLSLLVFGPALYVLGDRLGGSLLGLAVMLGCVLASFLYARAGDGARPTEPPGEGSGRA